MKPPNGQKKETPPSETDVTEKTSTSTRPSDKPTSSPDVMTKPTSPAAAPMTHIYVLYTLVAVLSVTLVATLWLGTCRLNSLQRQIDSKLSVRDWEEMLSVAPSVDDVDVYANLEEQGNEPEVSSEEILHVWIGKPKERNTSEGEGQEKGEDREESGSQWRQARTRRSAEKDESMGDPDDWVWMSSFSRIPGE